MTLQYRTRDMSDDRRWHQRVRLCRLLLMEVVDRWCRDEREFPVEQTVAAVLYLFSPRCEPFHTAESDLRQSIFQLVDSPRVEYAQTWPQRQGSQGSLLVEALTGILAGAVCQWREGSILTPSLESVQGQILDELLDQRYVMIHRKQTTRRDDGGFQSHG